MIPESSLYPDEFDTENNLYVVHDGLRLRLSEDYNPGDTSITVEGDFVTLSKFPTTGQVTLTEQCSDVDLRAISFYYSEVDLETWQFKGLELLSGFTDVVKLKRITNITQNVMEDHHNNLKNALINTQEFVGVKGTEDTEPFGSTLEGRTNFLRRLVLTPRAWFSVDKRVGLVPFEVEFTEKSFRLGTDGTAGEVTLTWDFGDSDTSIISLVSIISVTDEVPDGYENYLVLDEDGGKVIKTYNNPGLYSVSLTVRNDFGEDTVVFEDLIQARVEAPDDAVIRFTPVTTYQSTIAGSPVDGPYVTPPRIRSPINELITIEIPEGENAATPNISFGGELLNESGVPFDPITSYTWGLSDDLLHGTGRVTKALYSSGGVYDLQLRTDTEFGGYRITTYEDSIDIVENTNLWLWTHSNASTVKHYEYGLISETFKTGAGPLTVIRDDSFLDSVPASEAEDDETVRERLKREFGKNVGFSKRGTVTSGRQGNSLLYWASGRSESELPADETIEVREFNGFNGTYITRDSISRPWNWVDFSSNSRSYFALGGTTDPVLPNVSPTNLYSQTLNLTTLSVSIPSAPSFDSTNLLGGATELMENVSVFDDDGVTKYGHMSVYRSAVKDNVGYMSRNDGVGTFFRIKSFYRLEGTVGTPFQTFRKLQDIQGPTKAECEMTNLINGIYLLNNSGSISSWNDTSDTWATGGPGINSVAYRSLQDTTITGFDSPKNSLLLTSDGDRRAYISFDYSKNAFLKFNQIDLTFSSLGERPEGEQFIMEIY